MWKNWSRINAVSRFFLAQSGCRHGTHMLLSAPLVRGFAQLREGRSQGRFSEERNVIAGVVRSFGPSVKSATKHRELNWRPPRVAA